MSITLSKIPYNDDENKNSPTGLQLRNVTLRFLVKGVPVSNAVSQRITEPSAEPVANEVMSQVKDYIIIIVIIINKISWNN